jgi:hypothetical protein
VSETGGTGAFEAELSRLIGEYVHRRARAGMGDAGRRVDLRVNLYKIVVPYMPCRDTWDDLFVACTDEDFDRMQELLGDELPD